MTNYKDCKIYELENCMTRSERLLWKKRYKRGLRCLNRIAKRIKKRLVVNEASLNARIRVINRVNKTNRMNKHK